MPVSARVAVTGIFALNGFLAAMWVAHIPVIIDAAGVAHAELGGLLLLLGLSAFVGMQLCGRLIDRFGSRIVTIVAAAALSGAICLPPIAHDGRSLALALAVFGFCNGGLDVSMNTQAVEVERCYRRPIMSAFHGYFSLGGLVGSGVVAAALAGAVGVQRTVLLAAAFGVVVTAVVGRCLLPRGTAVSAGSGSAVSDAGKRWWTGIDRRRLALLAILAFALMLAEGSAYDWSALQVVETFDVPDAMGAITFAAFSGAMAIARFGIDRLTGRLGPAAVVRYGSLLGMAGITLVVAAGSWSGGDYAVALAVIGWVVFGLGLAGGIPQIFTAAGNLTTNAAGKAISLVVGIGYFGMLAGPSLIGALAAKVSLTGALVVVAILLAGTAVAAGAVNPRG